MATNLTTICPRCGRHNVSRARYCAQCGLNLSVACSDELTRTIRGHGRRTGKGLILFLLLLGLFMAAMSSMLRDQSRQRIRCVPPAPRVMPFDRHEPWLPESEPGLRSEIRLPAPLPSSDRCRQSGSGSRTQVRWHVQPDGNAADHR